MSGADKLRKANAALFNLYQLSLVLWRRLGPKRALNWPEVLPKLAFDGKREPFEQRKRISGVKV